MREPIIQAMHLLQPKLLRGIFCRRARTRFHHEILVGSEILEFGARMTVLTERFHVACPARNVQHADTHLLLMMSAKICRTVVRRHQRDKVRMARLTLNRRVMFVVAGNAGRHQRHIPAGRKRCILDAGVAVFAGNLEILRVRMMRKDELGFHLVGRRNTIDGTMTVCALSGYLFLVTGRAALMIAYQSV